MEMNAARPTIQALLDHYTGRPLDTNDNFVLFDQFMKKFRRGKLELSSCTNIRGQNIDTAVRLNPNIKSP